MAVIIAKGQKTITGLQDGYSIIATPANIVIPSNADGSNPILSGAKSRVLLQNSQGVNMTVNIISVVGTGCTATYSGNELTVTSVSADSGNLTVTFNSSSGYVGSINIPFAKLKQGESTYNVLLSNEAHAIPALYDGRVDQAAIDLTVSKIIVLKGTTPLTPVAANATPGVGQFRYNIDTVVGGTAVRIDNNTFKLATITSSTCVIKVKVYLESLSRVVDKEMVITKVVGGNPDDFNEIKSVFDGWRFADTNEFDGNKIKSGTITADKIIVETLFAKHIATNNIGARTTINVLPTDSNDPTGNLSYYKADGIRQYYSNGRVSSYQGIVENLPVSINGSTRILNGQVTVTFRNLADSPILYYIDESVNGGLQYAVVNEDVVYNYVSQGYAYLGTNFGSSATPEQLGSMINTRLRVSSYVDVSSGDRQADILFETTTGGVWQRIHPSDGTKYVIDNNSTTNIANGWYFNIQPTFSFRGERTSGGWGSGDFDASFSATLQYFVNGVPTVTRTGILSRTIGSADSDVFTPNYAFMVTL